MNPPSPNQPAGFNLPPPYSELPVAGTKPEAATGSAESARASAEMTRPASSAVPPTLLPLPPSFTTNAVGHGTGAVAPTTYPTDAGTTQSEDLIEKEYVNRAKAIVEKTQNNPYQQSKELNFLRADFMETNYQKQIKLSE